ncbi:uncharacterized protein LOC110458780 [Mizuhopecten yessoensis]|uniref:uncharacterized protein LOC110458780 n=1 Tax=Mizuhopecten yessoensis TaxID=6573 RepID=UPI000B45B96D|nr:uncharacterized protein LOC110458780 [Mizuhopecten yessoensis]
MTAGHTTRYILLAVAFTFIFHMTEGGQLCGLCTHMVDPRDCDVVGECGNHEECSISQYVSPTGHILYDIGCESSLACRSSTARRNSDVSRTSRLIGAGNVVICSTCCNDTQTCNVIDGHCNSQGNTIK